MRKESRGMAFRHLYAINLTMLGKQGWRLMTNHDIIVTKVFKAKYFPSGNFLDAQLGNNLSFVWRSIHALQVMVNQGLRWRLQAALGEQTEITKFSQQEYERLQNVKPPTLNE